ncbi:MAG: CbtA family protein [Pseudomonadota bacterium]
MITRIARTALAAGAVAGFLAWGAHQLRAVPLILQAETYEQAASSAAAAATAPIANAQAAHPDAHADNPLRRHALGFLTSALVGIGYAFILVGAIVLSGRTVDWRAGALWGLGGFVAFAAAPALGLPPELPGMSAAAVGPRQAWWLATALASAAGLAAVVFAQRIPWRAAGAVLIVLPHLVGAPRIAPESGLLPAELAAEFAVVALLTSAMFWLALGATAGHLLGRTEPSAEAERA